ncbi:hypothetical protein L218DRAFT_982116 [Marasmius fiardii PR-910]|nr:hypothetical protein L218DRAFT_982116 [Marasmius fiardii PR-910]
MVNDLPKDNARTCVYPAFREVLFTARTVRNWTWCEVFPDTIVGFTPNGSQFSLALHWYLSLYTRNHVVKVPFPGVEAGWTSKFTPTSARTVADFSIYVSLHPAECSGGQVFNIADRETPSTFQELSPRLAWWALVYDSDSGLMPGDYISENQSISSRYVGAGEVMDGVGTWSTFDRRFSLKKLGFVEDVDPTKAWIEEFLRFREAGLIS